MVIRKFLKAVERLRGRFDFGAAKEKETKSQRAAKAKRPPKRKRHR